MNNKDTIIEMLQSKDENDILLAVGIIKNNFDIEEMRKEIRKFEGFDVVGLKRSNRVLA